MVRIWRILDQMCQSAFCTCVATLETADDCDDLVTSLEAAFRELGRNALVRMVDSRRAALLRAGKPPSASIIVKFGGGADNAQKPGSGAIRLPLLFAPGALGQAAF